MGDFYILDRHDVTPCIDIKLWGEWLAKADRKVKREIVGKSDISTVFLGLDHSFKDGSPLLFETLVFGGPIDGEMNRYETWDEAVKGHNEMVRKIETLL